jgi:hypothetical protein
MYVLYKSRLFQPKELDTALVLCSLKVLNVHYSEHQSDLNKSSVKRRNRKKRKNKSEKTIELLLRNRIKIKGMLRKEKVRKKEYKTEKASALHSRWIPLGVERHRRWGRPRLRRRRSFDWSRRWKKEPWPQSYFSSTNCGWFCFVPRTQLMTSAPRTHVSMSCERTRGGT